MRIHFFNHSWLSFNLAPSRFIANVVVAVAFELSLLCGTCATCGTEEKNAHFQEVKQKYFKTTKTYDFKTNQNIKRNKNIFNAQNVPKQIV